APAGTVAGVSGFQVHFASDDILTPGDEVDALVAMNPAALKTNLKSVKAGGIVIVNEDAFTESELKKAGYTHNPLENGTASGYRLIKVPIDRLNAEAVKDVGLTGKQVDRCKNFYALGVASWLYSRPLEPTLAYIEEKFGKKNPAAAKANTLTLKAGYYYGESCELFDQQYQVGKAKLAAGTYRKVTGNEAVALGMVTAAHLAGKELFYGSYPITPASDILHNLSSYKNYGVVTFQAEDEICAMGATIGAAFGGALAATGTSGPGLALKTEGIGLAVITELPMVIVDVQRGGPSTGLPTKTEQSDLFQALIGRNGECPVPVIAAASPADCFDATVEAFRIAVKYMTPVMLLTDGFIGNSAEPWLVADVSKLEKIPVEHPTQPNDAKGFWPYKRNADGARPWAIPGTPGLEHRVGGLEKADGVGTVSHDPANHDRMVNLRAAKVAGIKPAGAPYLWTGPESGDVLLLGWGGTYGHIKAATMALRGQGVAVSACQLRYINPLPADLGEKLKKFKRVILPEINLGQLRLWLRAKYLIDIQGLNCVRGQPFTVHEIVECVRTAVGAK
ncbi:MAG TPA: 2-oxoacid:acceptor oxidoreductase subunit alpha, partial [Tepidisphaeraceae bacterium]|nr:2-oxoacid:acceptor oxidoreductase subunit alpha [Tepidisphaeraceae bacterium]